MIIRKIIICLALLFSACAGPGQFKSKKSWAESTLKKLTLREKIAQMMVVSMNMRFMNYESAKWNEIQSYIAIRWDWCAPYLVWRRRKRFDDAQ